MTASPPNVELLAEYLEPRFGNIYENNLDGGDAGFDVQPWTDELRAAVRHYLLHELPDNVSSYVFTADTVEPDDAAGQEARVDTLIDRSEPWEIALAVRQAAVAAVPTLDQLIGHLDRWQWEDERLDAATWLTAHADGDVPWRELAYASDHWELMPDARGPREPDELVGVLTPPELLVAWHYVVGPAPSDLTDAEWALLVPFLPPGGPTSPMTEGRLAAIRRAFDGMLYRYDNNTTWGGLPERYGKGQAVLNRQQTFKRKGVFGRALTSLENGATATRLVTWLRSIEFAEQSSTRQFSNRGVSSATSTPISDAAIRVWAKLNGHAIGDRGRLPLRVVQTYSAAQAGSRARNA